MQSIYSELSDAEQTTINSVVPTQARRSHLCRCWRDSNRLLRRSLPFALSLTFSWQVFIIGLLAAQLNDDPAYTSAINWIQTLMTVCLALALTPLHGINYGVSYQLGKLKAMIDPHNELTISQLHQHAHLNNPTHTSNSQLFETTLYEISSFVQAGLMLSPFLAALGGMPLYYSANIITDILGQDESVANTVQSFLRPYSLAVPGLTLRMCFEQMLYASQYYTKTMQVSLLGLTMGSILASTLSLTSLDYGLPGIAYGFAADSWLTAGLFGYYLLNSHDFQTYPFGSSWFNLNKLSTFYEIARYGLTQVVSDIFELGMTFALAATAACSGYEDQAAWQAAMQMAFFAFPLFLATSITSAQEIEILRAKRHNAQLIKEWLYHSNATIAGYMTILGFLAAVVVDTQPNWLGIHNRAVQNELSSLAYVVAGGLLLDALRAHQLHTSKGMGRNALPTLLNSFALAVGTGIAYLTVCFNDPYTQGVQSVGRQYLLAMMLSNLLLLGASYSALKQINNAANNDAFDPLLDEASDSNESRQSNQYSLCSTGFSTAISPISNWAQCQQNHADSMSEEPSQVPSP